MPVCGGEDRNGYLKYMIQVTDRISIQKKEIKEFFVRSSGPGGQNVNKVSTRVQVRFDAKNSPSLPEDVRRRLFRIAGSRMTAAGVLIINSDRFRARERNRTDAVSKLVSLIRKAAAKPGIRRKTMPSEGAVLRRKEMKRKRGLTKRLRRPVRESD